MQRIIILIAGVLLFQTKLYTQPILPENGELFIDTVVPRIDITIDPDTLEWLYDWENLESDIEFTAQFVFDNGNIRDTVYPVGFRLRGNTSRYSQKKSFKVSFNRFTQGGNYLGVEKLNLNGEHNDPSVIRAKVCWDILYKMEIPAPRSNHVRVYINSNYYGLYINVEHIDEEFVRSRFSYNDGNLYKCLWPANLNYISNNPDDYKLKQGDRRVYDLKTNTAIDDYSDIAHFIGVLNNTDATQFKCDMDQVFNNYDYLKTIAADVLTGNWDGYIYNQNNFYLYYNTVSKKMEYILYDLDNTLGIDWMGRDWATRNIYDWQQHGDHFRPLYERIMDDQELRKQYTYYMNKLVTETLDLDSLISAIEQRRDMISQYVLFDPYYPLDYGYSYNDFLNSYYQSLGGHVDYGLIPYLQTRFGSINEQLENTEMVPVIKYLKHERITSSEVQFNAFIEVEKEPADVRTKYVFDEGSAQELVMFDDGNHNDGEAGDHTFGVTLTNVPSNVSISYQITAEDADEKESILPCQPIIIPPAGGSNTYLKINEFMASNDQTIADEHGEYDDWIEIYNPTDETIWLGDKYLTDNLNSPLKWKMPDAYIHPGEFLLIWACGQPEHGDFHTTFKLDKDGEEIGIFNHDETMIDEYVFTPQTTDISEGRLPNGGINWVFFDKPTPGKSNEASATGELSESDKIKIYPNPAIGPEVRLSKPCHFTICDLYGRQITRDRFSQIINIQHYNKGMYFVVIDTGQTLKLIVQ